MFYKNNRTHLACFYLLNTKLCLEPSTLDCTDASDCLHIVDGI